MNLKRTFHFSVVMYSDNDEMHPQTCQNKDSSTSHKSHRHDMRWHLIEFALDLSVPVLENIIVSRMFTMGLNRSHDLRNSNVTHMEEIW